MHAHDILATGIAVIGRYQDEWVTEYINIPHANTTTNPLTLKDELL